MYSEISLHDYRLSYPNTVPIPTITQRGLIGPLLELQRREALRAARRKTVQKQLLATLPKRWLAFGEPSTRRRFRQTNRLPKPQRSMFKGVLHNCLLSIITYRPP
jgi:hypothetical protein